MITTHNFKNCRDHFIDNFKARDQRDPHALELFAHFVTIIALFKERVARYTKAWRWGVLGSFHCMHGINDRLSLLWGVGGATRRGFSTRFTYENSI